MTATKCLMLRNGEAAPLAKVPVAPMEEFRRRILRQTREGSRIASLFGFRPAPGAGVRLAAILAHDRQGLLEALLTDCGDSYSALTPDCPQAQLFEREMAGQFQVRPEGHPWLKPVRFEPHSGSEGGAQAPGMMKFFGMEGEEVHEVAVGPVHAGIIEPGHFRFQCHGENVYHLEISLGYQHRGVERALVGGPGSRSIHYAETLAGDTTIGHTLAYVQAVEALAHTRAPARAQALRAIALELERLANHTGDLGALAGDVGYLPTLSYCGRIRGDFLNLTALLCGNRFGRELVRPGGVAFDLEPARAEELSRRIQQSLEDVTVAVELLWKANSVCARFERTGVITPDQCESFGLVGIAARACGLERDTRQDFPAGAYRFFQVPVSTYPSGDVFARAYVRWLEIQRSIEFIRGLLKSLPEGALKAPPAALAPDSIAVSLAEGWRGEIAHVALTDSAGRFLRYKVVDPSFHNWFGLALALRGQQISDFPLCNKSFNLSYCGHDL